MDKNKQTHKLTDEQFLEALREYNGIFVLVAKGIEAKYGITYTRHAVSQRAYNFMDELREIRGAIVDYSEGRLIKCINDDTDIKLSVKVAQYMLNNLGKDRGYGKNGVDRILHQQPEQVYDLDGEIIRF